MEHPHPNPLGTECLDPGEVRQALGGFASLTQHDHNELLVLCGVCSIVLECREHPDCESSGVASMKTAWLSWRGILEPEGG